MEFIPDFIYGILKGSTDGDIDDDCKKEIEDAIIDGRFEFLKKGDTIIGFYVWHNKDGQIFINNMCVLKMYRDKNNLLPLRKYLRDKLKKHNEFCWKNRKHNKERLWKF